jgi:hypothetical protein
MLAGELGSTEILSGPSPVPPAARLFRAAASAGFTLVGVLFLVHGLGVLGGRFSPSSTYGWTAVVLGGVLIVLGVFNFLWFGRAFSRRAMRMTVSSRGLSATLPGGRTIEAEWKEPSLRVDITNTSPEDPDRPLWLSWQVRTDQVYGSITRTGSTLIENEAAHHGLRIETQVFGSSARPTLLVRVRPK